VSSALEKILLCAHPAYYLLDQLLTSQVVPPWAGDLESLHIAALEEQLSRRFCSIRNTDQLLKLVSCLVSMVGAWNAEILLGEL
jgi:hypothetical protein